MPISPLSHSDSDATTALEARWNAIPHHPLGTVPDDLPDENPVLYRRIIAKRAIVAAYEESELPEACIVDLLADLRHLCDALGLDFAQLDRAGFLGYATERVAEIESAATAKASPARTQP